MLSAEEVTIHKKWSIHDDLSRHHLSV